MLRLFIPPHVRLRTSNRLDVQSDHRAGVKAVTGDRRQATNDSQTSQTSTRVLFCLSNGLHYIAAAHAKSTLSAHAPALRVRVTGDMHMRGKKGLGARGPKPGQQQQHTKGGKCDQS